MYSLITWSLTLIALYGTWLNTWQDRKCFYYWIVSNAGFCVVNYLANQHALALLFGVYLLLAIRGLEKWKTK